MGGVEKALSRLQGNRFEAQLIPGAELPQLPAVDLGHRGGADKAPEARAVGPEDDGHIAGEVDGAKGVGVVVDVRGVEPRVPAVLPHPLRLWPKEANACARGVVVHFPLARVEGVHEVRS